MADLKERTFIAIKPDGVQRGIIGEVIKRFEAKGFKLVGMKMLSVSRVPVNGWLCQLLSYMHGTLAHVLLNVLADIRWTD